MKEKRWVCAHVAGLGECLFRWHEGATADVIEAREVVVLFRDPQSGTFKLTRSPGYKVGTLRDPVLIRRDAIHYVSEVSDELTEACTQAWRTVQPAKPGDLQRLEGGNSRPRRRG